MADLDSTFRMRQIDREVVEKLHGLQKSRETEQRIRELQSGNPECPNVVEKTKSTISGSLLDKATQTRRLLKRHALDKTLQILSDIPTANPSEIAVQIGKSLYTVYDYFDELEAAGKLHRNGSMNVIS